MTEHEKMQREKMCIDKPTNGVDPQTESIRKRMPK